MVSENLNFVPPLTSDSAQLALVFNHHAFPILGSLSFIRQSKHKFVITRCYFGANALFWAINSPILFQSTRNIGRAHDCSFARALCRYEHP